MKNNKTSTPPITFNKSQRGLSLERTNSQLSQTAQSRVNEQPDAHATKQIEDLIHKFGSTRTSLGAQNSTSRFFNITTTPKIMNTKRLTRTESQYITYQRKSLQYGKEDLQGKSSQKSPKSVNSQKHRISEKKYLTQGLGMTPVKEVQLAKRVSLNRYATIKSNKPIHQDGQATQQTKSNDGQQRKSVRNEKKMVKVNSLVSLNTNTVASKHEEVSQQSPQISIQIQRKFQGSGLSHASQTKKVDLQATLTPKNLTQKFNHRVNRSITGLMFSQRLQTRDQKVILVDISEKVDHEKKPKQQQQQQSQIQSETQQSRKRKQPQQIKKQNSQPQLVTVQNTQFRNSEGNFNQLFLANISQKHVEINTNKKKLNVCQSARNLDQVCKLGPKTLLEKPKQIQMISSVASIVETSYLLDEQEWLPLHQACLECDAEKVEILIRQHRQSVDKICNGYSPLHLACQIQCRPVIERLLLAKARTNVLSESGDSVLHFLAASPKFDKDLWDLIVPFCTSILHLKNKSGKSAFDMLSDTNRAQLPFLDTSNGGLNPKFIRFDDATKLGQQEGPMKPHQSSVQLVKKIDQNIKQIRRDSSPNYIKKKEKQPSLLYRQPSPPKIDTLTKQNLPSPRSSKKWEISLEDFRAHQLLGTGSFGEVFLIERKTDKKLLAMKVLQKKRVREQNLQKYALTERNVMSSMGTHPFIIQLLYAFQTIDRLFLVSDYAAGGDLSQYLEIEGFFKEQKAKLYAAEILLALEALHSENIIYRDLKPDNVVIGQDGHLMLTDFGLSREGVKKAESGARSFCGSYAYLAPEMVRKTGHGKTVDWYLLGVILYEMLTGLPPYYADDKNILFENILTQDFTIENSNLNLSDDCVDLLKQLLQKEPQMRLGNNGAEEIKRHPFFQEIDWKVALEKGLNMPDAYLADMALKIIQQQPYLVLGHPSTVGKPCPVDHPSYIKNWSYNFNSSIK